MRRLIGILLWGLMVLPMVAQDELCIDGTLLFREDFGGNDPNDPAVSMASVPGMSSQYRNSGNSLGSGNYTIRKEGWHNGIQWHWQDDHTYPDDKTRGYLLEVDGIGGAQPFYSKTIDGLLANTRLTFSAYVVNVHYAGQLSYFGSSYVYPRMKFVLKDPTTGDVLAEKSTGDIQPDWRYGTPDTWKYARDNQLSAEWQLVGMNFVVPEGVESIQMFIYNDVERNGSGNDFAIDDIEIHLCLPVPLITSDPEPCADSVYDFTVEFENDGRLIEPLEYKWYYSTGEAMDYSTGSGMIDGNGWWWEEIPNSNTPSLHFEELPANASGWYKIAISGDGNIDYPNRRTESEPFQLSVKSCPPPPLECTDGILLFREDFGGNEESDPKVSHTPVPGMSYTQIYVLAPGSNGSMGSGRYLVSKEGYRNSTDPTYSVWHIMDDHTYPGDKTRGYMMEVDGGGGRNAFYRTTLTGLCPGSRMSFSAYIANLTTAAQYNIWRYDRDYVHPKLQFVIKDVRTGQIIAQQGTDTISHDWNNYPKPWRESAAWQLVGMNFTIPAGSGDIELSIINNANGDTGNDFAIDDIEVRLCGPTVSITAPDSVCIDTKNIFTAVCDNDGLWEEPLQYKWYFSSDSLNWEAMSEGNSRYLRLKAKPRHSGWYKVAVVAHGGDIERENCRSVSEPHKFYVIDECPPILCPEGVLLKHEDLNGSETSYSTLMSDLCSGSDLSFIINMPSSHPETRLMLRLYDGDTGAELVAYDTGDIPSDSLQVGTTFTVPEGVSNLRWTINNNGGSGPLHISNIEVRLCMEPIAVSGTSPTCRKKRHTFRAAYENYGTLTSPEFRWEFSSDSAVWTILQEGPQATYTIPVVHKTDAGWYRVTVANAGSLDNPNCREGSSTFRLETMYCNTATEQHVDTTACDTLLHYDLEWRGHIWTETGTVVDTLKDFEGDDSLYVHKTLQTKICCPEILNYRIDSAICDSLMPFLWFYQDTMLLFTGIGEQEIEVPHRRWENCIGEIHTLALDTFHCERLYLLIHNKYNWQLVCNNVELARLFPELHPVAFQWFKDSVAVEGANEDDYAEQNELHGVFQLRIKMDNGLIVWSNILEILDTPEPQPVHMQIYNSSGMPVSEERMTRGVYLIRYQQGDKVWTEKKIVL